MPAIRFFFCRPGALGDTLLCAPVMAAVRRTYEPAHITLAAHAGAVGLLRDAALVDVGLSQDDARLLGLFSTAGHRFNPNGELGAIDVAVAWLADPNGVVARNLRHSGADAVIVAPSLPTGERRAHVVEHLLATLAPLGLRPRGEQSLPLLSPPEADRRWAIGFLRELDQRPLSTVAVHPGSGSKRKNWAAAGFAAVADALSAKHRLLFVSGPADEQTLAEVLARVTSRVAVADGLPLPRLAALLAECSSYLGNDSGVSHLAGLLGVPTVALFGPTDDILWRPCGPRVRVLRWEQSPLELTSRVVYDAVLAALP
jgi:ADP-heptose:LPS heptosyltransferase